MNSRKYYKNDFTGFKHGDVFIADDGIMRIFWYNRFRKARDGECLFCGKWFARPPHKEDKYTFCSNSCAIKGANKHQRIARVTKRCAVCWTPYRISKGRVRRRKTCGDPACMREYKSRITTQRHFETGQRLFGRVE